MTNAYCSLTTFKNRLGLTGTTDDTAQRLLLQNASRVIDAWCGRHFYVRADTRYFDGDSQPLRIDDLLSINASGLKTDEDGDGTFEVTFAVTDYLLYPISSPLGRLWPKTRIYLSTNSNYGGFAAGIRKGVEIAGMWGFGTGDIATPYVTTGTMTNEGLDTTETGVDVVSGAAVEAGQTILVESEQMYVQSVASNTLTVVRGVNGTTAATHDTGKTVYVYEYPEGVRESCLMTAARLWKRRDSAYSTTVGLPDMGAFEVWRGLDADVKLMLEPYRRILVGAV